MGLAVGNLGAEPVPHLPEGHLPPVVGDKVKQVLVVDLAQCRALALQHHPALRAYQASLAAAQAKVHALDNIHLADLVRRDLPTRRCQAMTGLRAAEAQLHQAQWEVLYGVTRMYFTAVFAQEQLTVANDALDPEKIPGIFFLLTTLEKAAAESNLRRDIRNEQDNPDTREKGWRELERVRTIIESAQGRRVQAKLGIERALVALREAIGLEPCYELVLPPDAKLPFIPMYMTREQVVALALHRRGEIAQAQVGHEVSMLEVKAQGYIFGLSGQTFGAGSDLHAQPVPIGMSNGEYRPGAIGIEMPSTLVGKRQDRQTQASELANRAGAVVDKTRHLVTLQAEDAYLKWAQATEELPLFEKAAKTANGYGEVISKKFNPTYRPEDPELLITRPDRPLLEEVLQANMEAIGLRIRVNQARFDILLGLTALERATAGGVAPGFDHPLPLPAQDNGNGAKADETNNTNRN